MPAPIQNLPLADLLFLGMVVTAFAAFAVSLFAAWTYVNLGGGPEPHKAVVRQAVRPATAVIEHEEPRRAA